MLSWHASFMRWPRFEPWMQKDGRSLLCEQKAENAPLNNFSLGGICWSCFWQYCSCTWWKAFCHVEAMSVYWDLAMFLFFCFFSNAADNHRTPCPMIFLDFPCAICTSQARTFLPGTWKDCPCHQDSWDVWQAIDPNLGVGLTCYNHNDMRGDVHDVTIS